jgi:hypothetical protein
MASGTDAKRAARAETEAARRRAPHRDEPKSFRDELNPRAREITHTAQRFAWVVMALVLAGALAGLFGGGAFARSTRVAENGRATVELDYARFGRARSPQRLTLRIDAPDAAGERVIVRLAPEFADRISVTSTTPAGATGLIDGSPGMSWDVAGWSEPFDVTVEYQADEPWRLRGGLSVQAGDGEPVELTFTQFLFP